MHTYVYLLTHREIYYLLRNDNIMITDKIQSNRESENFKFMKENYTSVFLYLLCIFFIPSSSSLLFGCFSLVRFFLCPNFFYHISSIKLQLKFKCVYVYFIILRKIYFSIKFSPFCEFDCVQRRCKAPSFN